MDVLTALLSPGRVLQRALASSHCLLALFPAARHCRPHSNSTFVVSLSFSIRMDPRVDIGQTASQWCQGMSHERSQQPRAHSCGSCHRPQATGASAAAACWGPGVIFHVVP
ncbi:hypothetical protein SCP_1700620 [Sparassis crispa]|uniref:Uncharacterized protein n=1 Tax=Sparassis crispa TaxID=139825 RepID=A0A401H5M0_9APHY|nr:hypothetical protein SCP_1700620 [Sparassis crispa]GBE89737.1 hypothetical protein SCP_1700620 [Sparassis crispa]